MAELRERLLTTERNLETARRIWQENGEISGSDESLATLTKLFGLQKAQAVVAFNEAHDAYYAVLREIAKLALDAGFVVSLPLSHDDDFREEPEHKKAA